METAEHPSFSRQQRVFSTVCCVIISLGLLTYTAVRAATLSFTHDEAITFNDYVIRGPIAILDCYDANNHPLNTALMVLSRAAFGESELALRLPSILAHVVYLIFAGLLAHRMNNLPSTMAGFLILTVNPYLLDFFSLARGYAWGLAALLGSIHFLMAYTENTQRPNLRIAGLTLAALSVFANYAFFLCYLAFVTTCVLIDMANDKTTRWTLSLNIALRPIWKHVLLHLLILVPPMLNLRTQGALYFGGTDGFLNDTLGTPIRSLFYGNPVPDTLMHIGSGLFIALLIIPWVFIRPQSSAKNATWVSHLMVTLVVLGSLALHVLLRLPSPMDRSALFLLPLASLALMFFCRTLQTSSQPLVRCLGHLALGCALGPALVATYLHANITHTCDWKYDADTRRVFHEIQDLAKDTSTPVILNVSWVYEPSLNFYRSTLHADWLAPVTRDSPEEMPDYFFYTRSDARIIQDDLGFVPLRTYPISGAKLTQFDPAIPQRGPIY